MATMVVKKATSGIFDQYRGVFVNRGVFLKAPPDFFSSYPSNFENPPFGWEKLKVHVRTIERWDKKAGLLAPVVEVPPPAATLVSAPVIEVPVAVAEVVAEAAPVVADDVVAPPKRGRGRPRNAEKNAPK